MICVNMVIFLLDGMRVSCLELHLIRLLAHLPVVVYGDYGNISTFGINTVVRDFSNTFLVEFSSSLWHWNLIKHYQIFLLNIYKYCSETKHYFLHMFNVMWVKIIQQVPKYWKQKSGLIIPCLFIFMTYMYLKCLIIGQGYRLHHLIKSHAVISNWCFLCKSLQYKDESISGLHIWYIYHFAK